MPVRALAVLALLGSIAAAASVGAQLSPNAAATMATQREAMRKVAFLAGKWKGTATVPQRGGAPLVLTHTEEIGWKLDGLLMMIEGTSRDETGKVRFQAFATVSYDDAAKQYRFHAYSDGHAVDTELKVTERGFEWAMDTGPAHVTNTMTLTPEGGWSEITRAKVGAATYDSVKLDLKKLP